MYDLKKIQKGILVLLLLILFTNVPMKNGNLNSEENNFSDFQDKSTILSATPSAPIVIENDADLDSYSGSGTEGSPKLISNLEISSFSGNNRVLDIQNTQLYVLIENIIISGIMDSAASVTMVYLKNASNIQISNIMIEDCSTLPTYSMTPFSLYNVNSTTISDVTIRNLDVAVSISAFQIQNYAQDITISNSHIHNIHTGSSFKSFSIYRTVSGDGAGAISLTDNHVEYIVAGLFCEGFDLDDWSDLTISGNRWENMEGVFLRNEVENCDNMNFINNTFSDLTATTTINELDLIDIFSASDDGNFSLNTFQNLNVNDDFNIIKIDNSQRNVFMGNGFYGEYNDPDNRTLYLINLGVATYDNVFSQNVFAQGEILARDDGENFWYTETYFDALGTITNVGNYWADHNTDRNSSPHPFVEVPRLIFGEHKRNDSYAIHYDYMDFDHDGILNYLDSETQVYTEYIDVCHDPLYLESDDDLVFFPGAGTETDPKIIANYDIKDEFTLKALTIKNTRLYIVAENITVENFSDIDNSFTFSYLNNVSNLEMSNVYVNEILLTGGTYSFYGISLSNVNSTTISNCSLTNIHAEQSITVFQVNGYSEDVVFSNNFASNMIADAHFKSITVYSISDHISDGNVLFSNNTFQEIYVGSIGELLSFSEFEHIRVINNVWNQISAGLLRSLIENCSYLEVENNLFDNLESATTSSTSYLLRLYSDTNYALIKNNIFRGLTVAYDYSVLRIETSEDVYAYGNVFQGSFSVPYSNALYPVYLSSSAVDCTFANNIFNDGTILAYDDGVNTKWSALAYFAPQGTNRLIGNYWADHMDDTIPTPHYFVEDSRTIDGPAASEDAYCLHYSYMDFDREGLFNFEEQTASTSVWDEDTDDDGYSDFDEIKILFSNPLDPADPAAEIPEDPSPDPEDPIPDEDPIVLTVTVLAPLVNLIFYDSPPLVSLSSNMQNLSSIWYNINGNPEKMFVESLNFCLDATAWANQSAGMVLVTIFLNNTDGETISTSLSVVKMVISTSPSDDSGDDIDSTDNSENETQNEFPLDWSLIIVAGIVSLGLVFNGLLTRKKTTISLESSKLVSNLAQNDIVSNNNAKIVQEEKIDTEKSKKTKKVQSKKE